MVFRITLRIRNCTMEEKAFPRGGAEPSTDTARKLGAANKTHHEPKRVHKIFSDCENHPEDAIDPSNTVNHYERESNLFTKLKKQKLAEVKRKAAIKQHKKSKPKPEQLVREEERIVEHLTYTVRNLFEFTCSKCHDVFECVDLDSWNAPSWPHQRVPWVGHPRHFAGRSPRICQSFQCLGRFHCKVA